MSVFTSFGSSASTVASGSEIVSYSNVSVSVPTANTEIEVIVPTNAVFILLYNETEGVTKLAFLTGESGTNYWPVYPGFREELHKKSGVALSLFIQCPKASQTIKIIYGHSA